MSRVKSETYDNIFQARTPLKKFEQSSPSSINLNSLQNLCSSYNGSKLYTSSLQKDCTDYNIFLKKNGCYQQNKSPQKNESSQIYEQSQLNANNQSQNALIDQHQCCQQHRYKNLCSPLPQKEGMNLQNLLILTPIRDQINHTEGNCMYYSPQRKGYSSSSSYGINAFKNQQDRLTFDSEDSQQLEIHIDPFGFCQLSTPPGNYFENEMEDITRLRKDSINPHGKDLEMQEGLIQKSQLLQGQCSSFAENSSSINLDPQQVMQEIETAWASLESTSPTLINSNHQY